MLSRENSAAGWKERVEQQSAFHNWPGLSPPLRRKKRILDHSEVLGIAPWNKMGRTTSGILWRLQP